MERGKFYAVGTGPGNPELLTLKAVRVMNECPVIAAAESRGTENIALKTASEYIKGKEIIMCDMPMTRDERELDRVHDETAVRMAGILDSGKNIAFLTLGDPAVYSSVMYVFERIRKMGYEAEMIPGITSFSAAAAALKEALCERAEPLHIIPASYKGEEFDDLCGTKIYMKSGKRLSALRERLRGRGAVMVENASMENERVYNSFDEAEGSHGYFSLVILPTEGGSK